MMKKYPIFTPAEVVRYLTDSNYEKERKTDFKWTGFACSRARNRGMGGLSRMMANIPESIHILVAPQACMMHCIMDLWGNGFYDSIYQLRLTEKEVVQGDVAKILKREIIELLDGMEDKPKVVTITVTCIDGLIQSDYSGLKKFLKKEYGIRFGVIEMFPILEANPVRHTDTFTANTFLMMDKEKAFPKQQAVNLIGHVDPMTKGSDLYKVLEEAGVEVREIRDCKTLEEFDNMASSRLNLVLTDFSLYGAKKVEEKYQIPYYNWDEHMSVEAIRRNYEILEKLLGMKLNYEEYYKKAQKKEAELREKIAGKPLAVGQGLAYVEAKAAKDLTEAGWEVKAVFVDKFQKKHLEYYEWLAKHAPNLSILHGPDLRMEQYQSEPIPVMYHMGGLDGFYAGSEAKVLRFAEEPYDFETLISVYDQIIGQIEKEEV